MEKYFKTLQGIHYIEDILKCFLYLNIPIEVGVKIELYIFNKERNFKATDISNVTL